MIAYLDTSAAMKLLVDEAESESLTGYLVQLDADGHGLVASWLLHAELHCAAGKHPHDVDLQSAKTVLDAVTLVDVTRGDLLTAGTLPGRLRSHDAVHLATALRVGADEVITYDGELAAAAAAAGLVARSPG